MNTLTNQQLFECLAPYLPYGVKTIQIADNGEYYPGGPLTCRMSVHNIDLLMANVGYFKLNLIPLPALTDELAEWLHSTQGESFDSFERAKECLEMLLLEPLELPFYLAQQIFKLHGDLFGLIESGYGVNKLEVK